MDNKLAGRSNLSKCALVTGASGYIGSHLVEGLLAEGWQVHAITRPSSLQRLLEPYLQRIKVHVHDGSMQGMSRIIAAAKPDVVFHLAAMVSSEHRMEDVDQMINSNILFSTQLVEAMFLNGSRNLVNTETFWQHCNGSDDYDPVCLYAATKQAFRDLLGYYVSVARVNAISLVLFDTYGADDPRNKFFTFLKQAAKEKRQIDMTPGEQLVDMTHVDDVVAAYLLAGEMLLSEIVTNLKTYAVSSGQRMTLKQLVELIVHETGIPLQPRWGGRPYRTKEVMRPWVGELLPGWQPKVDMATGVRDVFTRIN
jgi:nucleoside-diphosphate-sugar epimerase